MMSKVIIFGLLALVAVAVDEYTTIYEAYLKEQFPKDFREHLNNLCPNVSEEIKDDVTNNMVEKGYHCLRFTMNFMVDLASDLHDFKSNSNTADAANLLCNKANQYKECSEKFQEIQKPCYSDDDALRHLNLTYDFACGNNGDRVANPRAESYLVQRISLAIQRGNAASVMRTFASGFITEGGVDCFEKSGETLLQNVSTKLKILADETRAYSRIKVEERCDFSDDILNIVDHAFANCTSSYPTYMVKEYLKKYKKLIGCPEAEAPPTTPATTMSIPTWLGYTTPNTPEGTPSASSWEKTTLCESEYEHNIIPFLISLLKKDEDEDAAFFKSIMPTVKSLRDRSRLQFRIDVMNLLKSST